MFITAQEYAVIIIIGANVLSVRYDSIKVLMEYSGRINRRDGVSGSLATPLMSSV